MRMISYVQHDADRFESMIFTRIETLSKMSTVKHCSGSWRITSCAWSHTHGMMQVVFWLHLSRVSSINLIAELGACNGLLVDIRCIRRYGSLRIISCTLVSSSAWHYMHTSWTFLWLGTHHIIPIVRTQNMMHKSLDHKMLMNSTRYSLYMILLWKLSELLNMLAQVVIDFEQLCHKKQNHCLK